jgi:hypothetical protein
MRGLVMRALLMGSVLVLLAASVPARADDVPQLNIDPVCRGISKQSAGPGEKGLPDLGFSQCMQSEQAMRQKLVGEWSTFSASEKSNCVGEETSVPLPSYTDLVTCLEMARDARQLNAPNQAQRSK